MQVQQISIFLENRVGRLQEVTDLLAENDINIRALSLADTSDFGILRLIVNKPEQTIRMLREGGFTVRENEVIAVEVEDRPGGLARTLELFSRAGISVEYMYAFVERSGNNAVIIFRFDNVDQAIAVLLKNAVNILDGKKITSI